MTPQLGSINNQFVTFLFVTLSNCEIDRHRQCASALTIKHSYNTQHTGKQEVLKMPTLVIQRKHEIKFLNLCIDRFKKLRKAQKLLLTWISMWQISSCPSAAAACRGVRLFCKSIRMLGSFPSTAVDKVGS